MIGDNRYIMRKLLDLAGGLRFSKIVVSCPIENGDLRKELLLSCSEVLESFGSRILVRSPPLPRPIMPYFYP